MVISHRNDFHAFVIVVVVAAATDVAVVGDVHIFH
jgi:hypothetical protein